MAEPTPTDVAASPDAVERISSAEALVLLPFALAAVVVELVKAVRAYQHATTPSDEEGK